MPEEKDTEQYNRGSFQLTLHPNQSLSRSGFVIIMSLIAAVSFLSGIFFWSLGAWPVFGFFGLDVLLIYIAFRLNFRAARRYETIRIAQDHLTITRTAPDGRSVVEQFEAYWARAMITGGQLLITNRGRAYEVGNFLGEDEKLEVQEMIAAALDTYRKGGVLQSPSPSTSIIS